MNALLAELPALLERYAPYLPLFDVVVSFIENRGMTQEQVVKLLEGAALAQSNAEMKSELGP